MHLYSKKVQVVQLGMVRKLETAASKNEKITRNQGKACEREDRSQGREQGELKSLGVCPSNESTSQEFCGLLLRQRGPEGSGTASVYAVSLMHYGMQKALRSL